MAYINGIYIDDDELARIYGGQLPEGNVGFASAPAPVEAPAVPDIPQVDLSAPSSPKFEPPAADPMWDLSGLLVPWTGQFQRPNMQAAVQEALSLLPTLENFKAPARPDLPTFTAPAAEDVFKDPTYAMRKAEGEGALINDRAARGLRRTGATWKDLIGYASNFAANEYANLHGRKLAEHQTNVGNTLAGFDRDLAAARAEYEPNMVRYTTEAQAAQRATDQAFNQEWTKYLADWRAWSDHQNAMLDLLKWNTEVGLRAE